MNVSGSETELYESCVMCGVNYLQNVCLQGLNVSKSLGVLMDDHHLPEGILKIQNISSECLWIWACSTRDGKIGRDSNVKLHYIKREQWFIGTCLDRESFPVSDHSAQLDDWLHLGYGTLNLLVNQRLSGSQEKGSVSENQYWWKLLLNKPYNETNRKRNTSLLTELFFT